MEIPEAVRQAALELAEALRSHPAVARYRLARAAAQNDPELSAMETEVSCMLAGLENRQGYGEALRLEQINAYYRARQELIRHPLYIERRSAEREARKVIQKAGEALNGVLTIDFSKFVD